MPKKQRIIIIAGPNGAGKTTFAREYLLTEAHCPDFINVDLIAAGLSPFNRIVQPFKRAGLCYLRLSGVFASVKVLHLKLR